VCCERSERSRSAALTKQLSGSRCRALALVIVGFARHPRRAKVETRGVRAACC